jgi:putative nucleotidyltransferase with HDIG domain
MNKKRTVLIVDDVPKNIQVAASILKDEGYHILYAQDGRTALNISLNQKVDIILLDVMMPQMDGYETCEQLKNHPETKDTPIIFLTAKNETDSVLKGFTLGAADYILKPFNALELLARVKTHLELNDHRHHLQQIVAERTGELENAVSLLHKTLQQTVGALAAAMEKRDPYTAGHQRRVAAIAKSIATAMNLDENTIESIGLVALVHDIGKISVPAELLVKPSKLTDIEFAMIKTHASEGYEILKGVEFPWPIAQIVLQHHEYLNGTGYPQGLTAKDILLESRIITVSDVMEAMISHRPYRPALKLEIAVDQITKNKTTLYDPDVVDTCLDLIERNTLPLG